MHCAMIEYRFKPECLAEGKELWKSIILDGARDRPGFIEFRLLEHPPSLVAIGVWAELACSRAYMETGVFQRFLSRAGALLESEIQPPRAWEIAAVQDIAGFGTRFELPSSPEGLDIPAFSDFIRRAARALRSDETDSREAEGLSAAEPSFFEGDFSYRVSSLGLSSVSAREVAYFRGRPVWALCRQALAGSEAGPELEPFLRSAFMSLSREGAVWESGKHEDGAWAFYRVAEGGLGRFRGDEVAGKNARVLYRQSFLGGWIF